MPVILATKVGRKEGQCQAGKSFIRRHLQNNQSKTDQRGGLHGGAPALEAQSPEFKPHFLQERKEGREGERKEGRKEGREEKLKARVNEDTLCPNVSRLQTLCQAPRLQEFLGPPKRDS
jgi:hypothetical protein